MRLLIRGVFDQTETKLIRIQSPVTDLAELLARLIQAVEHILDASRERLTGENLSALVCLFISEFHLKLP